MDFVAFVYGISANYMQLDFNCIMMGSNGDIFYGAWYNSDVLPLPAS